MEAALLVFDGSQTDRSIPLPETIFLIGRDQNCHLRPHCDRVSKLHCAIAAWAGMVRVRDLRSRNGTYINGKRIEGEVVVVDGDRLQAGSVEFVFRIRHGDGTPIARPLSRGEVQWLLDLPADDGVLSPTRPTQVRPPADSPAAPSEHARSTRPCDRVSAGKHLHDYFDYRQSGREG